MGTQLGKFSCRTGVTNQHEVATAKSETAVCGGVCRFFPPVWGISELRSGCLNPLTFQTQYKNPETSQITKF